MFSITTRLITPQNASHASYVGSYSKAVAQGHLLIVLLAFRLDRQEFSGEEGWFRLVFEARIALAVPATP